jgi:hypothetical protein
MKSLRDFFMKKKALNPRALKNTEELQQEKQELIVKRDEAAKFLSEYNGGRSSVRAMTIYNIQNIGYTIQRIEAILHNRRLRQDNFQSEYQHFFCCVSLNLSAFFKQQKNQYKPEHIAIIKDIFRLMNPDYNDSISVEIHAGMEHLNDSLSVICKLISDSPKAIDATLEFIIFDHYIMKLNQLANIKNSCMGNILSNNVESLVSQLKKDFEIDTAHAYIEEVLDVFSKMGFTGLDDICNDILIQYVRPI